MSYDLMVFEASVAPRDHAPFMAWYRRQIDWQEPHGYDDIAVSSPALRNWFLEMVESFPPMNGPLAANDIDDPSVTDFCIGPDVIYCAFASSRGGDAYQTMRDLAMKHEVGFFAVSEPEGEIVFPDGTTIDRSLSGEPRPSQPPDLLEGWRTILESSEELKRVVQGAGEDD